MTYQEEMQTKRYGMLLTEIDEAMSGGVNPNTLVKNCLKRAAQAIDEGDTPAFKRALNRSKYIHAKYIEKK